MTSRMAPRIAIGSLFTGIGGLDLSVEAHFASLGLRAETVFQVEHDGFCIKILARHWPRAARAVRDVRLAGAANLPRVDGIAAGFPCQPVSLAGRRKARDDARWLWPELARVVGELGPRYLFLENVPGLLTADDGRALGDVLGSLAALGFAAEWDCFRASDVGAPHRRERWFLLAYRDDGGSEGSDARSSSAGVGAAVGGGEDGVGAVAHAARIAEREPSDEALAVAARGGARAESRSGGEPLADASRSASKRRKPQRVRGRSVPAGSRGGGSSGGTVGVDLVNPDRERGEERDRGPVPARAELPGTRGGDIVNGLGAAQPRVGRDVDGLPHGLDGAVAGFHGWPAGRGEPQHEWEPPRTATKVPHRPARLKALGNAVVWQQAALAWRVLWQRAGLDARVWGASDAPVEVA